MRNLLRAFASKGRIGAEGGKDSDTQCVATGVRRGRRGGVFVGWEFPRGCGAGSFAVVTVSRAKGESRSTGEGTKGRIRGMGGDVVAKTGLQRAHLRLTKFLVGKQLV